jgi:hypothetical protein
MTLIAIIMGMFAVAIFVSIGLAFAVEIIAGTLPNPKVPFNSFLLGMSLSIVPAVMWGFVIYRRNHMVTLLSLNFEKAFRVQSTATFVYKISTIAFTAVIAPAVYFWLRHEIYSVGYLMIPAAAFAILSQLMQPWMRIFKRQRLGAIFLERFSREVKSDLNCNRDSLIRGLQILEKRLLTYGISASDRRLAFGLNLLLLRGSSIAQDMRNFINLLRNKSPDADLQPTMKSVMRLLTVSKEAIDDGLRVPYPAWMRVVRATRGELAGWVIYFVLYAAFFILLGLR